MSETTTSAAHVAAGDIHTARAGAALLRLGGNAVDAAVGATMAAFVAEPVLTAPHGGGFALLAGPQLAPVAYDFFAAIPGRGLGPASAEPNLDFIGLEVSFGPTTQTFHAGRGATAVGLLMPGLVQMHAEHGRLPLAQVVEPAAQLAQGGVPLSAQVAPIAAILTPILTLTAGAAALFAPDGHVLPAQARFVSPQLAQTLRQLGAHGGGDANVAALLQAFGPPYGRLTAADLKHSRVQKAAPICVEVGGYTVALNPAPSLGGLLVALGLQMLQETPASIWGDETAAYTEFLACMAVTQNVRRDVVDPAARAGPPALAALLPELLAPARLQQHRQALAAARQQPLRTGSLVGDLGSTTHVSAIDAQGLACSITSSNGESCGHVVPGGGYLANNFLGEADINPAGFHVRPAGERMTSMMCPTLVLDADGRPQIALGTGGSNRIRTALLQVLAHHLLAKLPLARAIEMPRLHYEGGAAFIERSVFGHSLKAQTLAALQRQAASLVPFDAPNMFFGGVHAAASFGRGVGDPRRGGSVAFA